MDNSYIIIIVQNSDYGHEPCVMISNPFMNHGLSTLIRHISSSVFEALRGRWHTQLRKLRGGARSPGGNTEGADLTGDVSTRGHYVHDICLDLDDVCIYVLLYIL